MFCCVFLTIAHCTPKQQIILHRALRKLLMYITATKYLLHMSLLPPTCSGHRSVECSSLLLQGSSWVKGQQGDSLTWLFMRSSRAISKNSIRNTQLFNALADHWNFQCKQTCFVRCMHAHIYGTVGQPSRTNVRIQKWHTNLYRMICTLYGRTALTHKFLQNSRVDVMFPPKVSCGALRYVRM